ncbi:MAG: sodium:solute symporter family protein [Lacipirellulaceae bacterium]
MTELWIILGYLAVVLALGAGAGLLSRGTSKDFLLASNTIGPFLLLMTLFGTAMTAFALVGSTGEAFRVGAGAYGMLASSSGIIHPLCFFLVGVKLWSLGQKYGYRTQVEFFRDRLESSGIGVVLFPTLVALVVPYLLIGVMSAGLFVNIVTAGKLVPGQGQLVPNTATFAEGTFPAVLENGYATETGSKGGVPKHLASLVVCVVVLTYVFIGGMRGTAWANALQTMIFMTLGIIMFYVLAQKIGGESSFLANLQKLGESIPDSKLTRDSISPSKFLTYMLVPLSVGMFPHLFQQWLSAKKASSFKLSVTLFPVFIMIVWAPCVLLGLWAAGELVNVPPPVAAEPNKVLAFMVTQTKAPWLEGLLTAGVLSAIIGGLDAQFLCLGTMFTHDVALHYFAKDSSGRQRFSDRAEVWTARAFIVAIVAITYLLSLFEPRSVFALGVWCFSGFASLFPLCFAALYWRGLTKAGAYASVLTTVGMWFTLFRASGYAKDEGYAIPVSLGGSVFEVMPVVPMFVASLVALVIVSLVTPKPNAATLAKFFPTKA